MLIVRQARVSGVVPAALGTPSEVTIEVSRGDTTATFSLPFAPGDAVQALRAEYALAHHGLPFPNSGATQ